MGGACHSLGIPGRGSCSFKDLGDQRRRRTRNGKILNTEFVAQSPSNGRPPDGGGRTKPAQGSQGHELAPWRHYHPLAGHQPHRAFTIACGQAFTSGAGLFICGQSTFSRKGQNTKGKSLISTRSLRWEMFWSNEILFEEVCHYTYITFVDSNDWGRIRAELTKSSPPYLTVHPAPGPNQQDPGTPEL